MILKGSQRGGAKALAVHLLNSEENDHVEIHTLRGFLSADLTGAFKEIQAIAKGTRCRQPFFSVSLNPPPNAVPTVAQFEDATRKIQEAVGLAGQPMAMVFHEKNGRRHAHVVWSRIDAETMTARNLPHFKARLNRVARALFLQHGWVLPRGFLDKNARSPLTANLAEWQAAKRRGRNAMEQKELVQTCWAASEDRAGFARTLRDHGYILARGDRRNHVVVSFDGQVLAVARSTGKKTKEVKAGLGDPADLPSVAEALARHRGDVRSQFGRLAREARQGLRAEQAELEKTRGQTITRHRVERKLMEDGLARRWQAEDSARRARIKSGLSGLWQRVTGARAKILRENIEEAAKALQRDQAQRHEMITAQLQERRALEDTRTRLRREALGLIDQMRTDRNRLLKALEAPPKAKPRTRRRKGPEPGLDLRPL